MPAFFVMLKADMHCHVQGDPHDNIPYTAEQLIDHAAQHHYTVLALTCHDKVIFSDELKRYATSKKILLIPGAEKTLQGKHVLLYNLTQQELDETKNFDDLRQLKLKNKRLLVIAPHPFFIIGSCLGHLLKKNIDVFDAIEYGHYHTYGFNLNKKAAQLAKKYNKPLVGLSDCHRLFQFGTTYSLIDATRTNDEVIAAIKSGKVRYVSPPLPPLLFLRITCWIIVALSGHILKMLIGHRFSHKL